MKHTTLFPRTSPERKQWHATAERCKHTQEAEEEAVRVSISDVRDVCLLCEMRNKRGGFWLTILYIHLDHIKAPVSVLNCVHDDAFKNAFKPKK